MRPTTTAWLSLTSALSGALLAVGLGFALTRPMPVEQGLDPVVLVGEIQELARLETATATLQTTVHGTRGEGWMLAAAGEEIVFQGIGEARAGVDLAALGPEDVWRDGSGVVWVRLPEAEVFGVDLDEDRSQVLVRQQGWFGRADRGFESEARRAAVNQLRAQAEVVGLEERASEQAERVIHELLITLGAPEVRFASAGAPSTG